MNKLTIQTWSILAACLFMTACDQTRQTRNGEETEVKETSVAASDTSSAIEVDFIAPEEIRLGEQADVQFKVTNKSGNPLHDVRLIPQQNVKMAATRKDDKQVSLSTEPLHIGSLAAGETKIINGMIQGATVGPMENCFLIDYKTGFCASVNIVDPQLEFTRVIVDEEGNEVEDAYICDEVWAVYKVRNVGTGISNAVTVRDIFPESMTLAGDTTYVNEIGTIEAGEEWTERVKLEVSSPLMYKGAATATTSDATLQSEADSVNFYDTQIALTLTGPKNHMMYRTAQYTATVTNIGDYPARDIELNIDENLFDGAELQFNTQDEFLDGEFKIEALASGQSRSISFSVDFDDVGTYDLNVQANGYCVAAVQKKSIQTIVMGVPALRLEMIDTVDPVIVGETTSYRVRVKNQGTAEDTNVVITIDLPSNLEFISGKGDTDVEHRNSKIVLGGLTSIEPGDIKEWTFSARATSASKVVTTVNLRSNAITKTVSEEEPTNVVPALKE